MNLRRQWYYFRVGNGTYLNFLISFAQFITVEYYLAVSHIPFFQGLHLLGFTLLFLLAYSGLSIILGYLHMRKGQAWAENEVVTVENPFNYKAVPGKEKNLQIPIQIFSLQCTRLIIERLGIMTSLMEQSFENYTDTLRRLEHGEALNESFQLRQTSTNSHHEPNSP